MLVTSDDEHLASVACVASSQIPHFDVRQVRQRGNLPPSSFKVGQLSFQEHFNVGLVYAEVSLYTLMHPTRMQLQ